MPPSTAGAMHSSVSIEVVTGHDTLNGSVPVMPAASQAAPMPSRMPAPPRRGTWPLWKRWGMSAP
ncbi:Uncharacterised protein [Mycobacterium tuberculosis]|nr:Uncharacterised protein [Mycobacterium tuberculosis]